MGGGPPDEETLIERARAGDAGAYEELVRAYSDLAFRTAYLLTGSAPDAEEAAQDGFVNAFRALAGFRPGAEFRPWLLTIVANLARNRRRAGGRRARMELRAIAAAQSSDSRPTPEDVAEGRERNRELLAALNAMEEEDREVIGLRYLLELSVRETAIALGVPEGTVKSRLSRALGRLRRRLDGTR